MTLVRSQAGPVWRLTLTRPDARNAVNTQMLGELLRGLEESAADEATRLVLLSGEGRHFCAGADIEELALATESGDGEDYGRTLEEVMGAIGRHPAPVLTVVQGGALGAGCQLAVASDLVIAAADAVFGIPSAKLGVVITFENVRRLVLAVGPKRASDLLLSGRTITGEEAVAWGLASIACPPEELSERALAYADQVADAAPISVRASKRGIRDVLEAPGVSPDPGEFERMLAAAFASEDLREGIAAFRERRDPEFRGR